jgi:quinol monooxygenase YgiN
VTELVILVKFRVKSEMRDSFRRLIIENAAASLQQEPGCRQFDVLEPEGASDGRFVLYEIYIDDAAFDAHLKSSHYGVFDQASAPMVVEKSVERLRVAGAR